MWFTSNLEWLNMEAVPRLPLLQFPLKCAEEAIQFSQILKQGIKTYYQEDPESYNVEIQELENLRRTAVNASTDFSGCSMLKRYYCQLQSLCSRFPLDRVENLTFQWSFGFDDVSKTVQAGGIMYEMNSVMYNIAAMHMALGEDEVRNSATGMKLACTHFQCAAWAFEALSESKLDDFEFTPTGMTHMKNLALSQAQECILEKSMTDNRKPNIIAKVSMQVVEYLKVCQDTLEVVKKQPKYSNLPKFWEAHIKFKLLYYHAMTIYHLGMQSEEQQKIGEKIAYFEAAAEKLTEAAKGTKQLEKISSLWKSKIRDTLTFTNDVIQGKLNAAKKENDFVYHEKIPPFATLPDVKGASLVKCIPFSFTDPEVAGVDIFQRLVPMEAHQASSIYSEEKAKLLRQMGSQIEERNVELESYLASMQLDSFAYLNDESLNVLPQELVECCADLNSRDAYRELTEAMSLISNAQHEVDNKLGKIQALLLQEEEQEKEFGVISGAKQPPSQILNELKREVKRCREAHEAAQDMNKTLHSAITTHRDNIAKLSSPLDHLMTSIPSAVATESDEDAETRQEIQRLMKKVRDMKAQRADYEAQLRKGLQDDDITRELVVNQGNPEELFRMQLQKHSSIVSVLEQNMSAQPNILNALSEANANYAATRRAINQVRSRRSEIIYSLIASYQAFMNIVQKVDNAKVFYSKMETQLNKALARAKSLCKVEEEQREEKLSANVKRFTGGYGPLSKNPSEPSAPAGPKLKDYLMAGIESKNVAAATPMNYSYDYSSSSVRPSPVGSEIQDTRVMNVSGYGPQATAGTAPLPQSYPYQTPLSQPSPHHVPTPQSISRQVPLPQQYQPPRPQSMAYQTPGMHSIYNQTPANVARNIGEPQHIPPQSMSSNVSVPQSTPFNVSVPQSTPYNVSQSTPYQNPIPQPASYPNTVPKTVPYQGPGIQPKYQHQQGQIPSSNTPQATPYQIPNSQFSAHHIGGTQPNVQTAGTKAISAGQQPGPQPGYRGENRSQPVTGSAASYSGTVAPSVYNQVPGQMSKFITPVSQHIPYQIVGPGAVPQQVPRVSGSHATFNNQTPHGQNYPGQQTIPASNLYQAQSTSKPLPYGYGVYPHAGANPEQLNVGLPRQPGSDVRFPRSGNVTQALPNSGTAYQIPRYATPYQRPPVVPPTATSGQQYQGGNNAQNYPSVQQQYQTPFSYVPQGDTAHKTSTTQTLPQNSYSQHYMPSYSSMQTVPSNGAQNHSANGTTQVAFTTSTAASAGQQPNQRYGPSGFGNYPNWSATNTNTVSFNPMTSSIHSPNTQPIVNPGTPTEGNYPVGSTAATKGHQLKAQNSHTPASSAPSGQSVAEAVQAKSTKESLSNLDLLAGIDITQTMKPLYPQTDGTSAVTSSNNLPDAVQQTEDDFYKLDISAETNNHQTDETILAKLAKQPKRSTSTVDPLSVESVLNTLATETERFSKVVLGLDKKSLNGPTNLELKWKELSNSMDRKCASLKISVSRCYPMKNRFADLLPFDETRVVLPSSRDDYINASHVQVKTIENSIPFIMTQAPMPNTFVDFWLMIWDNQVETIVCLNSEAEVKGQIYYPTKLGAECNYSCFSINLKQMYAAPNSSWIRRTFHVTHLETKVTKAVLHCQFLTWPPGEMPESPSQFLQFVQEFHDLQKQQRNKMRPSVVHCVSGTGRSGAFVVVSAYIKHLNQTGGLFDIWKLIIELCQQRRSALQDKSYLLFLYSSALYYAQDVLMKRGILTDKATFEDNPREKSHVRHPSADLLTSDFSKIKANLGLDTNEPRNNEPDICQSTLATEINEDVTQAVEAAAETEESKGKIQIGGTTLPPNLAASVDPQQLTIDASKKAQKMSKDQFINPTALEDAATHPFQELDPLWNQKHS